jgi:hypothetical protein
MMPALCRSPLAIRTPCHDHPPAALLLGAATLALHGPAPLHAQPAAAAAPAETPPTLFGLINGEKGAMRAVRLPSPGADGLIARYLYTPSIAAGLGAPDLGMDRARLGETQILAFRKVGGKVIAEFENLRFRAERQGG